MSTLYRYLTRGLRASLLVSLVAMGLSAPTEGQSLGSAAAGQNAGKAGHADRCIAAIDLGIIAAEAGVTDVSVEAMLRACKKGPPVNRVDLGGILSASPSQQSSPSLNASMQNREASAEVILAQRLQKLNSVWMESEMDPAIAYATWHEVVFPANRPNEAFAYSTVMSSNSRSYSRVEFQREKPKQVECGAKSLVYWAQKADKVDELQATLAERESHPGTKDVVMLVRAILAADQSASTEQAEQVCQALVDNPRLLVEGPNAQLLFGYVWEAMDRVSDSSSSSANLQKKLVDVIRSNDQWPANEWLKYIVSETLRKAVESGDIERYRDASRLALTQYDGLSSGNSQYIDSCTSSMHAEAARRAFDAGHIELGAECLRELSLLPTSDQYGGADLRTLIDPSGGVFKGFLQMSRDKRLAVLGNLIWSQRALGVHNYARLKPTDEVPMLFIEAANDSGERPSRVVAGDDRICMTTLEWTLRDYLAEGRESEVLEQIAKLEAMKSEDADLARLMLVLAKEEPLPTEQLTKANEEGPPQLRIPVMDPERVHHFDTEILRHALANPDLHVQAKSVVNARLEKAKQRMQGDEVAWLRGLQLQFDENLEARTDDTLEHWVASCELHTGDLRDGRYPNSTWVERDNGLWGHQTGPNLSYLLLRYPLEGNFTITVRVKDAGWEESAVSLGGMVAEFLRHEERLNFRGVSERGEKDQKTDTMQANVMNDYRLDCTDGKIQITVGDKALETSMGKFQNSFPFFAYMCYSFRGSTFEAPQITGDYRIPREVDLISPLLMGWTAKFYRGRMPEVDLSEERYLVPREVEQPNEQWRFEGDEIRSVDLEEVWRQQEHDADAKPYKEERREAVLQYLRPLCDGERITLEFYHEPGKFGLTPSLGRVGMLLDSDEVALHWLTCENASWTGVEPDNRVVDSSAEQLAPPDLRAGDWNQLELSLAGDVVTLSVNGKPVYRRTWEPGMERRFGLFHDPTSYHIRVRNARLTGNWPEKLPDDFFQPRESDNL